MKLYYPPECHKPIKMCQCHDFLRRFSRQKIGVFHFMWRPFLLFTLAICDLFTPSFRLCWSLLDLYVQKKKEKSPWLKVEKKTGPKEKKKKKVFDDEWRKTLADSYIPDRNNILRHLQRLHFCLKLLFWIDICRRRHRQSHCSYSFL